MSEINIFFKHEFKLNMQVERTHPTEENFELQFSHLRLCADEIKASNTKYVPRSLIKCKSIAETMN